MNWVKTYYQITGDESTISLLKDQLLVDKEFTFNNLIPLPKELKESTEIDEFSVSIILFLIYLDENTEYDVPTFPLKALGNEDITEYLANNDCHVLVKTITDDVTKLHLNIEKPLVSYLEKYYPEKSKVILKYLSNYKKTGYYSIDDFFLSHYGSLTTPSHCETNIGKDYIKGSFLTQYSIPIIFFTYLKNTFPIKIVLSFLDVEEEVYVKLDSDFNPA